MKKALMLGLMTMAFSAHAEFRTSVEHISNVKYDGKTLEIGYRTGGGCESHTGLIELILNDDRKSVTVKVFDVTPKYDACEAYISGKAVINIKQKVAELLTANDVSADQAWAIKLKLPSVTVNPFEPNFR